MFWEKKTRSAYRVRLYRSSPRSHMLCVVLDSKQVLCFFNSTASGMLGVRWIWLVSVFWLNRSKFCSQHPLSSQLAVYHIPHILKTRPCIVNFCCLCICNEKRKSEQLHRRHLAPRKHRKQLSVMSRLLFSWIYSAAEVPLARWRHFKTTNP